MLAITLLAYVEINYTRDGLNLNRLTKKDNCNRLFDLSLVAANMAVIFDGITACTVNMTAQVPDIVNRLLQLCMYVS